MNNLADLTKGQIRMHGWEYKLSLYIAKVIVILIAIVAYLGRLIVKTLYRFKIQIFKLAIVFFAVNTVMLFQTVAFAPKAEHALAEYRHVEKPLTEQEHIVNFIIETFGEDADNAIAIAKCESGLNPKAYNDNSAWGGVSQDLGLFQLNKSYQGVTNPSFLYDYHINTLMAKKIFNSWGNFHAWSCSKKLGGI